MARETWQERQERQLEERRNRHDVEMIGTKEIIVDGQVRVVKVFSRPNLKREFQVREISPVNLGLLQRIQKADEFQEETEAARKAKAELAELEAEYSQDVENAYIENAEFDRLRAERLAVLRAKQLQDRAIIEKRAAERLAKWNKSQAAKAKREARLRNRRNGPRLQREFVDKWLKSHGVNR